MNINTKQSSRKEAEMRHRSARQRLIDKAAKGDETAIEELRERHSITKVWTKEEIEAYEGG